MKTQKEYAYKIGEIVLRDVESCQSDWFLIDQEIFMLPENRNKAFILGTRKTGCDLIILGGTNCDEGSMEWRIRRIITNGLTRTEMKNILLKISQKRILDGIGEDIPYQKNPLIK